MNFHRILELALFDLRWSLLRRKGLMYILPFGLFWYVVLKQFYQGAAYSIQTNGVVILSGIGFDMDTLNHLFIELPPSMSALYLGAIYTAPFFVMLAANDLFSSDLGGGYFRFLVTRCQRSEIFLARCLSCLLIIASCTLICAAITGLIATFIEGYPGTVTSAYFFKIIFILIIYSIPFVAGMAVLSAMLNSAITVMLLAVVGYTLTLLGISIAEVAFHEPVIFNYLLPSGVKKDLISIKSADLWIAIAALPAYTLIYGWAAWSVFRRRNL